MRLNRAGTRTPAGARGRTRRAYGLWLLAGSLLLGVAGAGAAPPGAAPPGAAPPGAAALAAPVPATAAPAAPTAPAIVIPPGAFDIPFEKYTLDNGLEVILAEDSSLPRVAVNLWYHVGPRN
jgi:hypothetical protein